MFAIGRAISHSRHGFIRSTVSRQSLSIRSLSQAARPSLTFPSRGTRICEPILPQRIRTFTSSGPRNAKYMRFGVDPERPLDWRRWDLATKISVFVVVGGGVYYLTHLEKVPETGRWRFMDINPKVEAKLAKQSHEELLQEFKGKILPPNHPLTRHIRRVVVRLLESNNLGTLQGVDEGRFIPNIGRTTSADDFWDPDTTSSSTDMGAENVVNTREWNLLVVNDDSVVNAMCAYGNVVVFTGILPICKDEQGLAAVLGHEIGHVVARHASERYSMMKVLLFVATILEALDLGAGFARIITTLLLELPNSRTQELEADKIGIRMSARACFDPGAAAEMHTRLEQVEKKHGRLNVNFLYTHPTGEKRIKLLRELMPEAYAIMAASPSCAGLEDTVQAFRAAAKLEPGSPDVATVW